MRHGALASAVLGPPLGRATDAGVKLPIEEVPDEAGFNADDDDDEVYEIEKVLSAEKVGGTVSTDYGSSGRATTR